MSFAHSTGKFSTQCPYCEHLSPDGSKFCNECGAALHLRPCAQCGALNDVSLVEACGRCGESLSAPNTAPNAAPEPAPAAAELLPLEAEMPAQPPLQQFDAPGPREDEPSLLPSALTKSSQPSWRVAVVLLLLIIGGGAVFLINRQPPASASAQAASAVAQAVAGNPALEAADKEVRPQALPSGQPSTQPNNQPRSPAAANISPSPSVEASTQAAVLPALSRSADSSDAVVATPAPAPAPRRRPGLVSSNAAPPSASVPSKAILPTAPTSAGPVEAIGLSSNSRPGYPTAPPKAAKIGACTEAVAALGLCAPPEVPTQR